MHRNLLLLVGPKSLLNPRAAAEIAFPEMADEIEEAARTRQMTSYVIDDKLFVTLTDASEYAMHKHPDFVRASAKLGQIYFAGYRNYVKIGFTAGPVAIRLASMQTEAPLKIELYATLCGTIATERILQARFNAIKLHGEWFRTTRRMRSFLSDVRSTQWQRALFT